MKRIGSLLRHLLAIVALPLVVLVAVPVWLARGAEISFELPATTGGATAVVAGLFLAAVGALLFSTSLFRFGTEGQGTLAPWDPPRNLVVKGPYAYVRNPMISGVILLLFAECLVLRSSPHLAWAGLFLFITAAHIPIFEEPQLRSRFGAEYDRYARNVPRLVPRLRPWRDGSNPARNAD